MRQLSEYREMLEVFLYFISDHHLVNVRYFLSSSQIINTVIISILSKSPLYHNFVLRFA